MWLGDIRMQLCLGGECVGCNRVWMQLALGWLLAG